MVNIGSSAFANCSGLDTIYYDAQNCNYDGTTVFNGCTGLDAIVIGPHVQTIPANAFINRSSVHNAIVIPDSVASIGNNAFQNCSGLSGVTIGTGVNTIGSNAFYGCNGLRGTLTIPQNVTSIGANAFQNCSGLSRLLLNTAVTTLPQNAFSGCSGLRGTVSIHSGMTSMAANAFANCSGLDTIYYDAQNCSYDGTTVFSGCAGLDAIILGPHVQTIPANAFINRSSAHNSLVIPDSVTSIGNNAFQNCSSLSGITIGTGVNTIGSNAFYGCNGLRGMLILPQNVTSIGANAFQNCSGLSRLALNTAVTTLPQNAFYGCSGLRGTVSIHSGMTSMAANAFANCSGLDTIYYDAQNCNYDGTTVFSGCTGLDAIILGPHVQAIPANAFINRGAAHNILIIPSSVTSIGPSAFQNCSGFSGLTLNTTLTSLPASAFSGCSGMQGTLNIPDNITTIGVSTFSGCSGFSHLRLPNHMSVIPNQAFYGCSGLTDTLLIPACVTTIGNSAFQNCSNLRGTLNLPDSLTSLGTSAFRNCDNIIFLNTNNSTAAIGANAFQDCDRLYQVEIGNHVPSIGSSAFQGCFRLTHLTLGSGISSIGTSAFNGCVRMVTPPLPSGLATIGANAFYGCSLVGGSLLFPASITSIGNGAYQNTATITRIEMRGSQPPTIYANTFASASTTTPVRVPCGSVLNYYVTDYWENFSNLAEAAPYQLTVSANDSSMGHAAVALQPTCSNHTAQISATANTGFHFIHWSDGNTANPRQLTMYCDSAFVAQFAANNSYITVTCNDSTRGMVSGSGMYGYNAPVVLTATPYANYHFLRWSDGSTQNPRYMAATQDSTFTAIFISNVSTITLSNNNPTMGTVSGGGVYYYQNQVVLSATANYGYHFAQWNDGITTNPRTITVSQDSLFTAHFAINIYAISAVSNNSTMGSVSGGGNYNYLSTVGLTASSTYGYHFVQWSDGSTDNPRSFQVTRDSLFTAQFAANTYQITVTASDPAMGSAYGGGCSSYHGTATLSATAAYGYHFVQWSDGNTDNPRLVTVTGDATYTAQFAINTYSLTVNSGNPAIGSAAGGGTYNYNTPVNITATPNYGYHFTQWSDGNTDNPRLVTVVQNATYTAQFAINSYAISAISNNATRGNVTGSGTYTYNTQASIAAAPFYGYHFTQWNDGNTDNPRTFVVTQDASYTAQFDPNTYSVQTASTDATIGSVTGGGSYSYLSQVALTAVATPHYHFVQWTDSVTDNPRTFTVTRDTLFTAQFVIDSHSVTLTSANTAMGTVTSGSNIAYGSAITFAATPNYGYHFTQWNDGNLQNPRRVTVTRDTAFTAQFDYNSYQASFASSDTVMGSVTEGGTYNYLTPLQLVATPRYGYHFVQWSDSVSQAARTLVLTCDTVLVGQFAINQYALDVSANDSAMGSVTGGGNYNYLSQVSLAAVAATHHHFVQWSDGSTTNPRLVTVTGDSSFVAQFAEDTRYTITAVSNDDSRGRVAGGGSYYNGDQATLTATAYEHYHFAHWSDGNESNPRTVRVVADAAYTALFEPDVFTVTVTPNDPTMGAVYGGGEYAWGSEVQLTARPFPNYGFRSWNDGDTHLVRLIAVIADADYQAIFYDAVGVDEAVAWDYTVSANGLRLTVTGAENRALAVYDIAGRRIYCNARGEHSTTITLPATGVYLIQVEGAKVRKVVVR